MQIVINKCYGGFGLSNAAEDALIGKCEHSTLVEPIEYYGGPSSAFYEANKGRFGPDHWKGAYNHDLQQFNSSSHAITRFHDGKVIYDAHRDYDNRSCPELLKVIKAMGKDANGQYAELRIVEIPDGRKFEINDYDGVESVHAVHEVWG